MRDRITSAMWNNYQHILLEQAFKGMNLDDKVEGDKDLEDATDEDQDSFASK
jgi:hypothetical protein